MMGLSERQSNTLQSYEQAKESELIGKGWIPAFIPTSSYNIKEHHSVDVPEIYVELNFNPKDISAFEKACSLLSENSYKCENSGYPVEVKISNENHAIIKSIRNGT